MSSGTFHSYVQPRHEFINGDTDYKLFQSNVRVSFMRSARSEAENSPETSAYWPTITRITTEMYRSLTTVLLKIQVLWAGLLNPDNQATTILRNVRSYLTIDKPKHPRRPESLCIIIFTFHPLYIYSLLLSL